MSGPETGTLLAAHVAEVWIANRPTGHDEDDVRAVMEWRAGELGGAAQREPWDDLTRGTVPERLRDAARDVRLLVSALRCGESHREHLEEDMLARLVDLESTLAALGRLATLEEHAVCFALETLRDAAEEAEQREVDADDEAAE